VTSEHPLLQRAREAPESPGVYRFQDAGGEDLYVGKALNLRRRVLSYMGTRQLPGRTRAMLELARGLDFTVTATEIEAFVLENTLIKRLRPRFNVMLRDDKTYPYVRVTTGEMWPRVDLVRTVRDDGHTYFGPFMGQRMARRLMELARTRFQVRTCRIEIDGTLPRPCLYHHMRACLGPCVASLTTPEDYQGAVQELLLFLGGRHRELLPLLEAGMWSASEREDFELAARYRDLASTVRRLSERESVRSTPRSWWRPSCPSTTRRTRRCPRSSRRPTSSRRTTGGSSGPSSVTCAAVRFGCSLRRGASAPGGSTWRGPTLGRRSS